VTTVDVADLSVVFLTYDEPKKEEFWIKIQNMVPWAVRVDGVKGSDAAHKAAADASETDRFILIDGDNIPDPEFFNQTLVLDETSSKAVFRWRARNHINGLMYGNGGLSCWTKEFAYNMRTHEASDGSDATAVEFCFDPMYWAMHDCYSTTYPNQSPFQAWRAGFREGVKMTLDRGRRQTLAEYTSRPHRPNQDALNIWHNVGRDVENGEHAIEGARLGTAMVFGLVLHQWDYRAVQSFDKLQELYSYYAENPQDFPLLSGAVAKALDLIPGLQLANLGPAESAFFKRHYKAGFKNKGIMVRE
jgi:hypothetical protein